MKVYQPGNILVKVRFNREAMTALEVIEWVGEFLDRMRRVCSLFNCTYLMSRSGKAKDAVLIDLDQSNLQAAIVGNVDQGVAYVNSDGSGNSFSLGAKCRLGYSMGLITTMKSKEPGVYVALTIGGGAN